VCEYCGCQDVPAIAALTEEHDEIRAVARDASRAASRGNRGAAADAAHRLLTLLRPHTEIEEQGLFPAALSVLTSSQWETLDRTRADITSGERAAAT
jgi:hemerythrin-like domain-containing protein